MYTFYPCFTYPIPVPASPSERVGVSRVSGLGDPCRVSPGVAVCGCGEF